MKPYGIHAPAVLRSLYRQHEALELQQVAAESTIAALDDSSDPEDWDEHDRICAEHDRLSDEIAGINRAIWELEEAAGFDEWRAERAAMPIVL